MFIKRTYNLNDFLEANRVLVIWGARQVGKTTLLKSFLSETTLKYKLDSGDNILTEQILGSRNILEIVEYCSGYDLIVIDEAQRIHGIGLGLKIIVDNIPNIKVIVTGSSAFELAGQIGEPLTGRKYDMPLYPISQIELLSLHNHQELTSDLHNRLIFGSYPRLFSLQNNMEKKEYLEGIVGSYLIKDILELDRVKSSGVLLDLLKLIALQVGGEVSLSELGRQLSLNVATVARYLDLLEKAFVIFNLRGYSGNLRNEITRKSKYYFYDNGVRNAIISNFNELDSRSDVGQLWENFLMAERMKKRKYHKIFANSYFWRTHNKKEIDLIEDRDGKLFAYEFKWKNEKAKEPKEFAQAYPNSQFEVVTQDNYLDFVA